MLNSLMLVIMLVGCSKNDDQESENAAYFGMSAPEEYVYDSKLANTLAEKGIEAAKIPVTERFNPCWNRVWRAFINTFGTKIWSTTVGADYAYMFADWANENAKRLFENFRLKKVPFTGIEIPKGSVLVYPRKPKSRCGYSPTGGHIEIVVSPGKACSFFCGTICTDEVPYAYIPVKRNTEQQYSPSDIAFKNGQGDGYVDPNVPANMDTSSTFYPGTQPSAFGNPSGFNPAFGNTGAPNSYSNSVAVQNNRPASEPSLQCKYGKTSLGFCNISPDFSPSQPSVAY